MKHEIVGNNLRIVPQYDFVPQQARDTHFYAKCNTGVGNGLDRSVTRHQN